MSDWKKARGCGDNACSEWRFVDEVVEVRSSLRPEVVVTFTRAEWQTFVAAAKAGECDGELTPADLVGLVTVTR